MEGYIFLIKSILNYYEDIIVLSKYIFLSPKSTDKCKNSAKNLVKYYMFREELLNFVK